MVKSQITINAKSQINAKFQIPKFLLLGFEDWDLFGSIWIWGLEFLPGSIGIWELEFLKEG